MVASVAALHGLDFEVNLDFGVAVLGTGEYYFDYIEVQGIERKSGF